MCVVICALIFSRDVYFNNLRGKGKERKQAFVPQWYSYAASCAYMTLPCVLGLSVCACVRVRVCVCACVREFWCGMGVEGRWGVSVAARLSRCFTCQVRARTQGVDSV